MPIFGKYLESGFHRDLLQGKSGRVALISARQSEENDEGDEGQDGKDEDAAFGAGASAAEDGFAHGMSGKEMKFDH